MRRETFRALATAGAALGLVQVAAAQDIPAGKPDYLSDKLVEQDFELELGAWKLTPTLSLGGAWSDNLAQEPTPEADYYATGTAGMDLRGNVGAAEIDIGGSVETLLPSRLADERLFNIFADAEVEIPVGDHLRGGLGISYASYAEALATDSFDREEEMYAKPFVNFEIGKAEIEIVARIGRLVYPPALNDDDEIVTDERQHTFANLVASASWRLRPDVELFTGALARIARYDLQTDESGYRRGGQGFGAFVGLRSTAGEKLRAGLAAGFEHQTFQDEDFRNQTFAVLDGYVQWRPTGQLWLTALADSGFSETLDYNASGLLTYEATLKAEYALGERIVLSTLGSYELARYLEAGILERTTKLEAGLAYRLADHTVGSLSFERKVRHSDDEDENFTRNTVLAVVKFN